MIAWHCSYAQGGGLYFAKPSRKINKHVLQGYKALLLSINGILACFHFFTASLHLQVEVSF